MNIVPEHDLLYVSLEECREVAAVGEVALVAVLLQHQTSRECLKGFENISSHSQLRWPWRLKAYVSQEISNWHCLRHGAEL